jgi:hypothetical protein
MTIASDFCHKVNCRVADFSGWHFYINNGGCNLNCGGNSVAAARFKCCAFCRSTSCGTYRATKYLRQKQRNKLLMLSKMGNK